MNIYSIITAFIYLSANALLSNLTRNIDIDHHLVNVTFLGKVLRIYNNNDLYIYRLLQLSMGYIVDIMIYIRIRSLIESRNIKWSTSLEIITYHLMLCHLSLIHIIDINIGSYIILMITIISQSLIKAIFIVNGREKYRYLIYVYKFMGIALYEDIFDINRVISSVISLVIYELSISNIKCVKEILLNITMYSLMRDDHPVSVKLIKELENIKRNEDDDYIWSLVYESIAR